MFFIKLIKSTTPSTSLVEYISFIAWIFTESVSTFLGILKKSKKSSLSKNPFPNCFPTKFLARITFTGSKVY